jgi:hypothetical protein
LSIKDIRNLAFDLPEKYKLPHTFNKEKKLRREEMVLRIYAKKSSTVYSATRSHLTNKSKRLQQG